MNEFDRATRYLATVPHPAEGGRNVALNSTAYAIRERFPSVSELEFRTLLEDWASCMSPRLSDVEIDRTLRSAWDGAAAKGTVGSKANGNTHSNHRPHPANHAPASRPSQASAPAPSIVPLANYKFCAVEALPPAIEDGASVLLRTCFAPDEGVRISPGRIDDEDGREVPRDEGIVWSAKAWLEKFREKGGPEGCWSSRGAGVYVGINPMRLGGARDADVTAYRHALLEIDEGQSPEQQYSLWIESGIPCSAIISSGGKSVHAWVKIDAKDRREYDERVAFLHAHFAHYGVDPANKNPSRFSRLPGARRGKRKQELLATDTGAASWTEWRKRLDGDGIGKSTGIGELIHLDTAADPNCVIGFRGGRTLRYLCKGKSAWLLGPSGIGKSSLVTEFAVAWALGRSAWGIGPSRPLRSLIVQAENDEYDLAEMSQGIASAYGLEFDEETLAAVTQNVRFRSETRSVGPAFVERLHRMLDVDRPDVVWIDPLLSFAGIDVSKQDQVSAFLRTQLNPVLEATGVVAIGVHHTGKPRSAKETAGWTAIDWAYSGLGSSELVNWARAVMLLRPLGEGLYQLMLAKRGKRAGANHPDGQPTTNLFLRHAAVGIRWEQQEPPQEPAEGQDSTPDVPGAPAGSRKRGGATRTGRSNLVDRALANLDFAEFAASLPEPVGKNELARLLENWLSVRDCDLGKTQIKTSLIHRLVETRKLTKIDGKYTRP